jgi:predicted ribosome quality control (RQC) complex YloA/Tae2 family protein
MGYYEERSARRQGERDFERHGYYDRERYYDNFDADNRAYRRGYDDAAEQRRQEEEAEERAARRREEEEQHRRDMERRMQEEMEAAQEEEEEQQPEPEPEPIIEAIEQARAEYHQAEGENWP